jgi:nitrate reductase NapE component
MELFLNLAWVLLAALMVCLWPRFAPRSGPGGRMKDRSMQLVALAVLLLILFPVISVTDDLQAVQNPAETDSSLRKDHVAASPHSIFPAVAALPLPVFAGLFSGSPRIAATSSIAVPAIDHPALASIQSRPPPAA